MNETSNNQLVPWFFRAILVSAAVVLFAGNADAGECPSDKVVKNAMAPSTNKADGVSDTVIGSIDLSKKAAAFRGEHFRMRHLVVAAGGVVPWHSHGVRPAIIYITKGSITEYRSSCAVPIEHKSGEVTTEFGADLAHWWKNNTNEPVELLSADILDVSATDKKTM